MFYCSIQESDASKWPPARCGCTYSYAGGVGGEDGVEQDVGEERGEVAERLVSVVGDDDSVASSSNSWPAVTVSWRQSIVLLPP